ncbi:MAG: efflux RND transporter periplasmic adaptor subunit [Desulfuromonadaceae bacterium]|nr:efflux RND transporter periplasmic adaptor subunit [Desulfuromonadaceae bacterium]MDD2856688.1 efflux RND transporter periplasmic adaptor subunit [Desulfuromonadaceae bacterium]
MKQLIILISVFFLSLMVSSACTPKKEKAKTKLPVPVKTAVAQQKDVPVQLRAIGSVEATGSVEIKSQVSGQIARVHFVEGSDVEKGALLISIDPQPFQALLNQAEATLAKDLTQAKYANEQALRYEGLVKEGIVTSDQYSLLRANADSLAATVVADRAAVNNAKIQLGYCSIRSPISGRTGVILIQAGNLVKANDLPIVTINQISPINVTFSIPEKRLSEIRQGMNAGKLKLEALIPGNPLSSEAGTVSFLDNAVNAATGTIKLKGVFANKTRKLWPGQFADLLLTLAIRKNAVVVPVQAVQAGQQGEYVYVVGGDKKVEMRQVTSISAGDEAVIDKGLAAGEVVITDGQLRLTPGAVVDVAGKNGGEKAK